MVTPLGIPLMLEVLVDFAGGKKTSPRTIFPWFLAEDNPVISWWGNNLLNKVGGHVRALQGISFQNLLGISFLLGRWIPTSWGNWIGFSWGSFET